MGTCRSALLGVVSLLATSAASSCSGTAPAPRGEALVVVDTDVTVGLVAVQPAPNVAAPPPLVDRLRLDVYADDGTWLESRDVARRAVSDFPASFSVFTEHEAATALVRVRAYLEGAVRDASGPRLLRGGVDVTPPFEPEPGLAIDRLVRVAVTAGTRGVVPLVLHGACFGAAADLAALSTCVDDGAVQTAVATVAPVGDIEAPLPARVPVTFGTGLDCTAAPREETVTKGLSLHDDEVCIAGGAFTLGTRIRSGAGYAGRPALAGTPQRIAIIPALRVDRHEVTVGRYRAAVARGFVSPDISPLPLDAPLATSSRGPLATWSTAPLGREEYPLMGISWAAARAFCRFDGGDLLTEAQWEWVAAAAGRPTKTPFPWGVEPPSCEGTVFGRWDNLDEYSTECRAKQPFGPTAVTAYTTDRTPGGVVGMGGGLAEWVLDAAQEYASSCWARAPLHDPRCAATEATFRSARGGSWPERADSTNASVRESFATAIGSDTAARYGNVGFRCARAGSTG